ncbi:MAG: hypothetical protein NXI04_04520 [Planctomycetaceae bacterium]|nr:hypothetical protein [Planctomycetaceae bacterium]
MKPAVCTLCLCSVVLPLFTGCTQSLLSHSGLEQRVIEQFTDALDEENEPALRRVASTRFESTAMRSDDVLSDLRVLRLPKGDLSIVESRDIEGGRREVIVQEEDGGKYQFHLVKDPVKNYWVVDDVMIRQKKRGARITKSTAEVMDLLMTLREFLGVWESGSRDEILAMTSPSLTSSLSPLPDQWLTSLTSRIASNYEDGMARKPEANLNESEAVVRLPSKNGHIHLSISRVDGQWLVDDVEAFNHREEHHPGSVKRQADAINAVNAFLTAYRAEDYGTLQEISDRRFFDSALKLADLSLVTLPGPHEVPAEYAVRAYNDRLTFMIPSGREVIRVDLVEPARAQDSAAIAAEMRKELMPGNSVSRFFVSDVTLYDRTTDRQRSLSSIFTAPTRASLFLSALAERDLKVLAQISTTEFARATWRRVDPMMLPALSIPRFEVDGLTLKDSHSIADTTELEFTTGSGRLLLCRLLTQNGRLKIDDIQYPDEQGHVASLKSRLELSIPILEFATAWQTQDLETLQRTSSSEFNRQVLSHLESVPTRFSAVAGLMQQQMLQTKVSPQRATVQLGRSPQHAVTASLVMEQNVWVVDEVRAATAAGPVVGMRDTLRREIAEKLLSGSYSTVHSGDGHDLVVPFGQESRVAARDVVQQAAAGNAELSGKVRHAVYTRERDGGPGVNPIRPAVQTQTTRGTLTGVPSRGVPSAEGRVDSGIVPAAHQTVAAGDNARTARGVQVFGPDAGNIASRMSQAEGMSPRPQGMGLNSGTQPAIDMTPAATAPKSNDDFLYFGPDEDRLQSGEPAAESQPGVTASPVPRRITQPADAPIAIQ